MIEECPHGMEDPNWCSLCKHKDDIVVVDDSEYEFIAKYDGWCPECRSDIKPGDACVHRTNGQNVHQECA